MDLVPLEAQLKEAINVSVLQKQIKIYFLRDEVHVALCKIYTRHHDIALLSILGSCATH